MGGPFQLFDIVQDSMARKFFAHKKDNDGLEAPRNSFELQLEASQSYYYPGDELYAYDDEDDWHEKDCYPIEASMKRLINDEISKRTSSKRNSPSIVARLMGVDTLPLDNKSAVQSVQENGKRNDTTVNKFSKKEKDKKISIDHFSCNSKSSSHIESYPLYGRYLNTDDHIPTKITPREHPQEEELQKFKKEFEAWQASRFRECSKIVEIDNIPAVHDNNNKKKVHFDTNSELLFSYASVEHKALTSKLMQREKDGNRHLSHNVELLPAERSRTFSARKRSMSADFHDPSFQQYENRLQNSSSMRIVVLKPGPDRIWDHEESWTSSSGTLDERGSIEDFLEEVKERLKCELQGKTTKKGSVVRGKGIETPFSEKPPDDKQIAKQVRESVTQDLWMNLLRSESTRSYRSEIQVDGEDSPEFINKDTRRFLSARLRNILKRGTHMDCPGVVGGSPVSSLLYDRKDRLKQTNSTSKVGNNQSYREFLKDEERQTGSFRHGDDGKVLDREVSPRNLVRSLSAPVSGTSFGKLLLEDRHVLTGAQIRRKHESVDNANLELKHRKKERFNIKEKVSHFRHFTLRSKLFGKKLQSMVEAQHFDKKFGKDIMDGAAVTNICERHMLENSTEVPPSPASFCSSAHDDFWRPGDYFSPVSTPDVSMGEDGALPLVFKEISSNLDELRRQLNQLDSGDREPEDKVVEQEVIDSELVELEDKAEAYVRDLLLASGLYSGSSDICVSRWDPLAKPISVAIFDKVEEAHKNIAKAKDIDNETTQGDNNEKTVDHKLLFDLLNEVLSTVLGPPITLSRFRRKVFDYSTLPPLRGRKLLDSAWNIIREYLYPPSDQSYYSLDGMIAKNLKTSPWFGLKDEELNAVGKEMEVLITGDLIEEVVKDMYHAL